MLFIDNQNINDPRINLAIEEYCVKHLDPEQQYLLFYVNQPSIIIGKNQNTSSPAPASFAMRPASRLFIWPALVPS